MNTNPQHPEPKKHQKHRLDGEGALFKSKTGKWIARSTYWAEQNDGSKKRKYITGTGDTPQQALKRLQANTSKVIKIGNSNTPTSPKISELRDQWIKQLEDIGSTQASTRNRNKRQINQNLIAIIGDIRASQLTEDLLKHIFYEELKDKTDYERRNTHQALNPFFNYLVKQDIILINPLRNIPRPKPEKSQRLINEDKQIHIYIRVIKAFLTYLENHPKSHYQHLYLPIRLQMLYGLRAGELLGLTEDCFENLARSKKVAGEMTIKQQLAYGEGEEKHLGLHIKPQTKSGKTRTVPLDYKTAITIQRRFDYYPKADSKLYQNLLFINPKTKAPYHPKKWTATINRALKPFWEKTTGKEQLPFRSHLLRHISATLLYEANTPVETIGSILGHSEDLTTLIYTHQTKTAKETAIQGIADTL